MFEQEEMSAQNRGYWGYRELTQEELQQVSGAGCGGGCGGCGGSVGDGSGADAGADASAGYDAGYAEADGPVGTQAAADAFNAAAQEGAAFGNAALDAAEARGAAFGNAALDAAEQRGADIANQALEDGREATATGMYGEDYNNAWTYSDWYTGNGA
jgi:hypothetical protein